MFVQNRAKVYGKGKGQGIRITLPLIFSGLLLCLGLYSVCLIFWFSPSASTVAQLEAKIHLLEAQLAGKPTTVAALGHSAGSAPGQARSAPTPVHAPGAAADEVYTTDAPSKEVTNFLALPGTGKFKVFGDPKICRKYWRWCYIRGNVEIISYAFSSLGMGQADIVGSDYQVKWMLADVADGKKYKEYQDLQPHQKINHLPGIFELGNKRVLTENMNRARAIYGPAVYDFFPYSYSLPTQRAEWEAECQRNEEKAPGKQLWALKQGAKDRGEGVSVITGPAALPKNKKAVVQAYVGRPYLLNGYKFTMRIYMLITSFDPLRIYLHRGACP
jgi:hypothetical protein